MITRSGYLKRKGEKYSYKIGICKCCEDIFIARSDTNQEFCSISCQSKFNWAIGKINPKEKTKNVEHTCEYCETKFYDYLSNHRRFCSKECFEEWNAANKLLRICKNCDSEFEIYESTLNSNSSGNFCSRNCYQEYLRGSVENAEHKRNLSKAEWKNIRKFIVAMTPFCLMCGNIENLHVHHIIPHRISKSDLSVNLVPLCSSCHTKIEGITRFLENEKLPWNYIYYLMKSIFIEREMVLKLILNNGNEVA